MATTVDLEELERQARLLDLSVLGLRFLAGESELTPEHFDPVSELASEIHGQVAKLAAGRA